MSKFPGENNVDFEVTFNEDPAHRLRNLQATSSRTADIELCDKSWTRDANLIRTVGFVKHSGNTDGIVGIALNGVPIYAGTSELSYDAFFPKSYGKFTNPKRIETDICLGSAEYGGYYKYYGFSPCIFETEAAMD